MSAEFDPLTGDRMGTRQLDFLYWHAVSKMRMADFHGASLIFRFITKAVPHRYDAALGLAYCLIRLGELEQAAGMVARLRQDSLPSQELRLLGRLHRRCEFESTRRSNHERQGKLRGQVIADTLNPEAMHASHQNSSSLGPKR
jgi:thioredoxin-like negative regulator of GroEL